MARYRRLSIIVEGVRHFREQEIEGEILPDGRIVADPRLGQTACGVKYVFIGGRAEWNQKGKRPDCPDCTTEEGWTVWRQIT